MSNNKGFLDPNSRWPHKLWIIASTIRRISAVIPRLSWIVFFGVVILRSLAEGKCSDVVNCDAAKTFCFGSLSTEPISCGIYYGCCYNEPVPLNDPDCRNTPCGPGCPTDLCIGSEQLGLTVGPTKIATNLAPSASSAGNLSVEVAVDKQGHIFYNWWNLGQAGRGWRELEGQGQTDVGAAAALVGKYLFVAIKGLDGSLYLNQGEVAKSFLEWQGMGFQSKFSPGAASSGELVSVVAADNQGRIFYNWWKLGEGGRGWKELDGQGRTNAAPTVTLVGNYMFVVIKGVDGYLYLNQGTLEKPFVGWQRLDFQSNMAPSATSSGNLSVVVAANKQGHLFYNWWSLGQGGRGWTELEGKWKTNAAPASTLVGNYLFVVIKGLDGNVYLNQGDIGKPFIGWQ